MPIVFIYGVHPDMPNKAELIPKIQKAVESVKNLELSRHQVTVYMPGDLVKEGLGEEINVFVEDLHAKPGRTDAERDELADKLKKACLDFFPNNPLVECVVPPYFDATHGHSSGRRNG